MMTIRPSSLPLRAPLAVLREAGVSICEAVMTAVEPCTSMASAVPARQALAAVGALCAVLRQTAADAQDRLAGRPITPVSLERSFLLDASRHYL